MSKIEQFAGTFMQFKRPRPRGSPRGVFGWSGVATGDASGGFHYVGFTITRKEAERVLYFRSLAASTSSGDPNITLFGASRQGFRQGNYGLYYRATLAWDNFGGTFILGTRTVSPLPTDMHWPLSDGQPFWYPYPPDQAIEIAFLQMTTNINGSAVYYCLHGEWWETSDLEETKEAPTELWR